MGVEYYYSRCENCAKLISLLPLLKNHLYEHINPLGFNSVAMKTNLLDVGNGSEINALKLFCRNKDGFW